MSDAKEALRIVHEKAGLWKIDRNNIGIMGSSAGGHLASTIATHVTDSVKPAFQILFYPVQHASRTDALRIDAGIPRSESF